MTPAVTPAVTRIEALCVRLVQDAPGLAPDVVAELVGELRAHGAPLALSIARVVELVAAGMIDPGPSLPAVAMACGTLADGRLSETVLEAARYEIETLLPVPGAAPRVGAPDVPVAQLTRGPRPRT